MEDWIVLGRVVGRATGWDQMDTLGMQLYGFKAHPGSGLPDEDPVFDFENGVIEFYDSNGERTARFDMVEVMSRLQRKEPV